MDFRLGNFSLGDQGADRATSERCLRGRSSRFGMRAATCYSTVGPATTAIEGTTTRRIATPREEEPRGSVEEYRPDAGEVQESERLSESSPSEQFDQDSRSENVSAMAAPPHRAPGTSPHTATTGFPYRRAVQP